VLRWPAPDLLSRAARRLKFARAIKSRSVFLAEVALGELETVLLEDALQMVYLYGEEGDRKYEAACRRYLARWIKEDSPSLADIAATACSFVERISAPG
jgi:hypothetical protein